MRTLKDFMVDQLNELFAAQIQLKIIVDKMGYQTSNEDLRHTFEQLSKENENELSKIEEIFSMLGESRDEDRYAHIVEGIGKELQDFVERQPSSEVQDARFIAIAQKLKHYAIALYGTLREYAHELGNGEAERILQELLDEAKVSDNQFTEKAESGINHRAADPVNHRD